MNYTEKQIATITRGSTYTCSNQSSLSSFNYPSFIALYSNQTTSYTEKFERTVTNVGEGPVTYEVKVDVPEEWSVTVFPTTLAFGEKYERRSYSMSLTYSGVDTVNGTVSHGAMVWTEVNGSRRVRSPIVVAPLVTTW
uniref:Subtilisin-like protease fibronectin type-III domain-containing protein n=1 Tax=Kalanchoe fedtschenkoi TaxID=63787 RepID=A0A7N0TQ08_KALFE